LSFPHRVALGVPWAAIRDLNVARRSIGPLQGDVQTELGLKNDAVMQCDPTGDVRRSSAT
jgi:hypothetical protein